MRHRALPDSRAEMLLLSSAMTEDGAGREQIQGAPGTGSSQGEGGTGLRRSPPADPAAPSSLLAGGRGWGSRASQMQGRGRSAREKAEDAGGASTGRKQRERAEEATARAAFGREREESRREQISRNGFFRACAKDPIPQNLAPYSPRMRVPRFRFQPSFLSPSPIHPEPRLTRRGQHGHNSSENFPAACEDGC
jgi:hypothetical protein